MQNKYIGDPGDFAKFLLLKSLIKDNETLGVNWYLVDDNDNTDGNKIPDDVLMNIDKDLFGKLAALRAEKPTKQIVPDMIGKLQDAALLGRLKVVYYSAFLKHTSRIEWFDKSMEALKDRHFIFCDPDNGVEVKSHGLKSSKSIKYITVDEIQQYFESGSNVIIYQHCDRSGDLAVQQANKKTQIIESLKIPEDSIAAIYCGNGGVRFFFVVMQQKDKAELWTRIKALDSIKTTAGGFYKIWE